MLKVLVLVLNLPVFGQFGEWGKVLDLSQTKKSLIFNKGSLNGLRENDVGFFINKMNQQFIKVAKGKVVRTLPGKSFWYLESVYSLEFLTENLYLVMEKELMLGRKKEQEAKTTVVLTQGQNPISYKDIPDKLRVKEKQYEEGTELSTPPVRSEKEIKISQYGHWQDEGLRAVTEYEGVLGTKSVPKIHSTKDHADYISKRRDDTAEGTLESLIGAASPISSDQKLIRMKERDGPLWSADLDDRQLRRYMVENGMLEEKKRQEFALENKFMDELLFNFSIMLNTNEAPITTQNMANPYALSLGYEYHLMRISRSLDAFSLQLFLETGVDYYNVGGLNARGIEWSLLGNINWYFLSLPSATRKFMGYLGMGVRYGRTDLTANELSIQYPYQIIAFPTLELGFKYRFPTNSADEEFGWGINTYVNYLKTKLNVMVDLQDDIYGVIYDDEIRLNIGLTFTF